MQVNDWNATQFFADLVKINRLAKQECFTFCSVSGLEGFEQTLHSVQTAKAFCCVSDIADGFTELDNTPHTRRVKTVFLAMRHAVDNVEARNECMETMRELFRQFMSALNLERIRLQQNCIYLDRRISFTEIDRYFFSGCACAYFQIAADVYTDISFNFKEWSEVPGGNLDLWLMEAPEEEDRRAAASEYLQGEFGYTARLCANYFLKAPVCLFENVAVDALEKLIPNFHRNGLKIKFVPHGKYCRTPIPLYTIKLVNRGSSDNASLSIELIQEIVGCDATTAQQLYNSAPATLLTEVDILPIQSKIDALIAYGNNIELEFVRNVEFVYHLIKKEQNTSYWTNWPRMFVQRGVFPTQADAVNALVSFPSIFEQSFNIDDLEATITDFKTNRWKYEVKAYDAEP